MGRGTRGSSAKGAAKGAAYTAEARGARRGGGKGSGPTDGHRDLFTELVSGKTAPAARILELRQAAIEYVERALTVDIGALSEDALAYVDHYLDTARRKGALPVEIKALVASAFGVFLGELLISRFGGRWLIRPSVDSDESATSETGPVDPRRFRLALEAAPLVVDPVGMAAAALSSPDDDARDNDSDPDEEVEGMITRADLAASLEDTLSRGSPVSSDYYYSLTGRFESICYATDVLVDLMKALQPAEDESDPAATDSSDDDAEPQVKQ